MEAFWLPNEKFIFHFSCILRNHNYMDKFYDCLKKHDLYEEYCDFSSDYYNYVFREWCEKHNINF